MSIQDLITQKVAGGAVVGSGALTGVTFLEDVLPEFQALAVVFSCACAAAATWYYVEGALQRRRERKGDE